MNDSPPNFSQRPWSKPVGTFAWLGLLAVVIFCLALLTETRIGTAPRILLALAVSVALAALLAVGLRFVRWLCHWRNLRRFLFAIVCLVTLVALAFAEENWRGKHAWEKYRRESEAKGEKFALAGLTPPRVPDDKNFALTPLLKPLLDYTNGPAGMVRRDTNGIARLEMISAELSPQRTTNDRLVLGNLEKGTFADLSACAAFYGGNTNYPQASPDASTADTILFALDKFTPELNELRDAAANRPFSRFPVRYETDPAWTILLPHLSPVRRLTTITYVRATAELEASRPVEAYADLKLGLQLSDSVRDEVLLIDHLVRLATTTINLQTLREGLIRHAWTEAQLAELKSYLASLNLLAEYKLAMRGERACEVGGLEYILRQGIRTSVLANLGVDSSSGPSFNPMPAGWLYQNMLTISRVFDQFILPAVDERARRVFPDISNHGTSITKTMRTGPYTIIAKMLLPALEKPVLRSARSQTYVDAARVACALESYRLANGNLPPTLEALTPRFIDHVPGDVIDGKPLRYRLNTDGGYLLYSVGWNQTDDGGQIAWVQREKERSVDLTQGDWVWQMPARK